MKPARKVNEDKKWIWAVSSLTPKRSFALVNDNTKLAGDVACPRWLVLTEFRCGDLQKKKKMKKKEKKNAIDLTKKADL